MLHLRSKNQRKSKTSATQQPASPELLITSEGLHEQIARRAYELYEQRGADGSGDHLSDWIRAEAEVLQAIQSPKVAEVEVPTSRSKAGRRAPRTKAPAINRKATKRTTRATEPEINIS